jgi:DNA recombination protein RmuC
VNLDTEVLAAVLAAAALSAGAVYLLMKIRSAASDEIIRSQRERLVSLEGAAAEAIALRERSSRLEEAERRLSEANQKLGDAQSKAATAEAKLSKAEETERANDEKSREQEGKREALMAELADARIAAANANATLAQAQIGHEEKLAELRSVRDQIESELKIVSAAIVKDASSEFLKRAGETFDRQHKENKSGLETLLNPIGDALREYQNRLGEMELGRKRDEGELVAQIRELTESQSKLRDTTSNLVSALRTAPNTRGRWGEHQLLKLLELAGMMEHVDFTADKAIRTEDGRVRPDIVLHMPGKRRLVIDAKTPMAAYLAAVDAADEASRELALKNHAQTLRAHANALGSKKYWDALDEAPDFVVMFVPGDNLYAAAVERDPDLFEDAYHRHVIIVTPTTFLALAKAIAYGWKQERVSREAQQILSHSVDLYKRMAGLGTKVLAMSRALDLTVRRHNEFIATIEGHVLPHARKFIDLPDASGHGEIAQMEPVETSIREPQVDRDLMIGSDPNSDATASDIDAGN